MAEESSPEDGGAGPAVTKGQDSSWVATTLSERDHARGMLGMTILQLERGSATVGMLVRQDMTNGFGVTHGGIVLTLADTAFAYACNSDERATVATGAEVSFVRPSFEGDYFIATATCRWMNGRNGLYDVTVKDRLDNLVADFRGRSFASNWSVTDPNPAAPAKRSPEKKRGEAR